MCEDKLTSGFCACLHDKDIRRKSSFKLNLIMVFIVLSMIVLVPNPVEMSNMPILLDTYLDWFLVLYDPFPAAYGQTSNFEAIPIVHPLSTLELDDSVNGITLFSADAEFGYSVTAIGDIDGNDVVDFAVGAPGSDFAGCIDCGGIYIILMTDNDTVKNSFTIRHNLGITLAAGDRFGASITAIGDVDGNGIVDLAVGAPGDNDSRGAVHIILMESTSVKSSFEIANGTPHLPILAAGDGFGTSVAIIGDVDKNGMVDLVVGAPGDDNTHPGSNANDQGRIYFILMNNPTSVNGTNSIPFHSGPNDPPRLFGTSIANIGDDNGDGFDDIAVGSPRDAGQKGVVYVFHLKYTGSISIVGSSTISANQGNGPPSNVRLFGSSVTNLGDIDRDGITDLAIGAPNNLEGSTGSGALYLVFRNPDNSLRATITIDGDTGNGPNIATNDGFGTSVTAIGDIDGNGITDIVVGAPDHTSDGIKHGTVHLISLDAVMGTSTGIVASANKITGISTEIAGRFGYSVTNIGDLNGDGVQDLVVGEPTGGTPALAKGSVYVLLMNSNNTVLKSEKISYGNSYSQYGWSVANIGDLDGDGLNEIMSAGPNRSSGTNFVFYVHFFNSNGIERNVMRLGSSNVDGLEDNNIFFGASITHLGEIFHNGTNYIAMGAPKDSGGTLYIMSIDYTADNMLNVVMKLNSNTAGIGSIGSWFGSSVTAIGDVDGNGIVDLAVGATRFTELQTFFIPDSKGSVHILLLENRQGSLAIKGSFDIDKDEESGPDLESKDGFGTSVTAIGDIDGDGVPDIAVGASGREAGDRGAIFVILLNDAGGIKDFVELNHKTIPTSLVPSSFFGQSIESIDDYNGDGIVDLAVGVPHYRSDFRGGSPVFEGHGSVYILSLDKTVFPYGVSSPSGNYRDGTISISVHFSEPVIVTGTPRIKLDLGTTDRYATYASGNGTSKLTFSYIIQDGDDTEDLNYESKMSLQLNGGTIKAQASPNEDVIVMLPPPDLEIEINPSAKVGPIALNSEVVIDMIVPVVTINSPSNNARLPSGSASFEAIAIDDKDGNIESIQWSSGDNTLGTGTAITATLSPGDHVVSAYATDKAGNTGSDTITITVEESTLPDVTGTTLDLDDTVRSLQVTFDKTIDLTPISNVDLTKFHIRQLGNSSGGVTLGGAMVSDTGDARILEIVINEVQRTAILVLGQQLELDIDSGAVKTINNVANEDDYDNAISISPDTTKPALLKVSFDPDSPDQNLLIDFNETINATEIDLTKLSISNSLSNNAGDVSLTGASITNTDNDIRIMISLTASQSSSVMSLAGKIYLKVNATAFSDLSGNTIDDSIVLFSTIDVSPTVRLLTSAEDITYLTAIPFTVIFSESVTVFDESDVSASSGTVQNVKGLLGFYSGTRGTGDGQFQTPTEIAINSTGYIYVADTFNHRIQIFDTFGKYVSQISGHTFDDSRFTNPRGIAINSTDYIYVTSTTNLVKIFDPSGNFVSQFGSRGFGDGQFDRPHRITINATGHVHIVDSASYRVQIFDPSGNYISQFPSSSPNGIAINATGHVYVTSELSHIVQIFDPSGNSISQFGGSGSRDGQFHTPSGIAINGTGHVYVADTNGNRVQIFDPSGNYLSTFGSSYPVSFRFPVGLVFDSTNDLYVVDTGNNRIFVQRDVYSFDVVNPPAGQLTVSILAGSVQDETDNDNVASNEITLTVITVPDAPTALEATPGNTQVTLEWTAPVNDGGSPIVDYAIQHSSDSGTSWTTFSDDVSADTSVIVTGLTNGQVYQFRVNATNNAGTSIASNVVDSTPRTVPSTPIGLTATPDDLLMSLSWSAPSNGGSPITGYIIQYKEQSAEWPGTSVNIGNFTSHIITGLTEDVFYDFRVNATNAAGAGTASTTVSLQFIIAKPYVTLSTFASNPTTLTSVPFVARFNEPIVGFNASDISISSGTIQNLIPPISYFGTDPLSTPDRIAVNGTGYVYVTDASSDTIQIFDSTGKYISDFGESGSGNDQLDQPTGIAINGTGYVYVADLGNNRVQIFDSTGKHVSQIPGFNEPQDIAINGTGYIYVTESSYQNRIQIFDSSNTRISFFSSRGTNDGQTIQPYGIAINDTGYIYVTDLNQNRIQIFDSSGNFVSKFGSHGSGDSQFNAPQGIAINGTGHVYVADTNNHRIQIFDSSGNFVSKFGSHGSGDDKFNSPKGITIDSRFLYVVDSSNNRIYAQRDVYSFDVTNPIQGELTVSIPAGSVQDKAGIDNIASNEITLTVIKIPDKPTGLTATYGNAQVTLNWTRSDDGGSEITDYTVQYSSDSGTSWQAFDDGISNTTSAIITGLTNGQEYQFQVSAINIAGESDTSDIVSATPRTVPGVPVITSSTPSGGQIELGWVAPGNGGSPITGYIVQYKLSTEEWPGTSVRVPQVTLHTIYGLESGQYDLRMNATNAVGNGTASDVISFTIDAEFPSVILTTLSPDPTNLSTIPFIVRFSEPVTGFNASDISISSGTAQIMFSPVNGHFGGIGSGDGQFASAGSIAINSTGHIFAADDTDSIISIFDGTGTYISEFGGTGSGNDRFNGVGDIAVGPLGNIHVADSGNNRISIFDPSGKFISQFGSAGAGDGQFNSPQGIAINSTGHIFVADHGNHRIQIFDDTGKYLSQFGSAGSGDGQFGLPRGLAINSTGHIFVADFNNHRIQIFDDTGKYLSQLGNTAPGSFSPINVAIDSSDRIYVKYYLYHSFETYDPSGNYLSDFAPPNFSRLVDIAFGPTQGTYITDNEHNRIYVQRDAYFFSVVNPAKGQLTVSIPAGSAQDASGNNNTVSNIVSLNIVGTPGMPTGLTATPGNTQVTLSWTAPPDTDGSAIVDYIIQYSSNSGTSWHTFNDGIGTTTTTTVTGLTNGVTYQFRVFATNTVETSMPSAIATTTPRTLPGAPSLTATPGNAQVVLSWTIHDDGGSPVTGYVIQHKVSTSIWSSTTATVTVGNIGSYTIRDLVNNVPYDFRINATNTAGIGPVSDTAKATPTASTSPDTTPPVIATPSNAIIVHQNAAFTVTDALVGVTCTDTEDSNPSLTADITNVNTAIVGSYTVTYSCTDDANNSAVQKSRNVTVIGTPSEPTLTAEPSNAQVTLSWTAPTNNRGSPITGYTIQYKESSNTWPGTSVTVNNVTSRIITSLTNGIQYDFRINATNVAGTGISSNTVSATPIGVPGVPTGLTAAPGNAQVSLSWTAPSNTGGSAITDYTIQYSTDGNIWTAFADGMGTDTSTTVTDLTNGVTYQFQVFATNTAGTGRASDPVGATPRTIPAAPTGLTATPGNAQVSLSWTAPSNTGGSAITDYTIQYSANAGASWTVVNDGTSTDTSATVTGITNGDTYRFRVNATNVAGTGESSSTADATPRTIPAAPTTLTATPGDAQIVLSWIAPNNGGSPITGYAIQHKPSTDAWPGTTVTIGNVTSHTIPSLTNGIQYDFRINATNVAGTGLSSGTAQATPVVSIAPDTTPPVIATPSDAITVRQNTVFTVTDALVGVTCTDTEDSSPILTADITNVNTAIVGSYTVTYSCTDDANNSAISQTRNVTVIGTPAAPTDFTIQQERQQMSLSWTAPNNGGSPITGYVIQYKVSSSAWPGTSVTLGNITSHDLTGFTNGLRYDFRVNATNIVGTGSASTVSSLVFDATPPSVVLSVASPVASPDPTSLSTISFIARFSEHVTGITSSDILTSSGTIQNLITPFYGSFGSGGSGDGQFDAPEDIAINGTGHIFVVDSFNNRVQIFDNEGVYVSQFGSAGSGDGQFADPIGIAINSTGYVYVPDTDNHRIQIFDSSGKYVSQFGSNDLGDNQLTRPQGITITDTGHVYVVNTGNNNIKIFDISGNYLSEFGNFGLTEGGFQTAIGIAINSTGHIFVTDQHRDVILIFDNAGNFLTEFGSEGAGDGQFDSPYRIAINGTDHMYVAEIGNDRIQIFDSSGNYLSQFDSLGSGNDRFQYPSGIILGDKGEIYISDSNNNRIYVQRDMHFDVINSSRGLLTVSIPAGSAQDVVGNDNVASNVVSLDVIGRPTAPTGLSATPSNTQVSLTWIPPTNNGGSPITGYTIQHKESTDPWPGTSTTIGNVTSHIITGLTNGVQYDFRINATNTAGTGVSSGIVQAIPVASTVPDSTPPTITINGANPVTISIGTTYVDAGATCTDDTDSTPTLNAVSTVDDSTAGSYTVTYICVDNSNNSAQAVRTVIVITVPGAPTGLSAVPGDRNVVLLWTAPTNNGGSAIIGYTLQYKPSSAEWPGTSVIVTNIPSWRIENLINGVQYDFRVNATNVVGTGEASIPIFATPQDAPDAPTDLRATPGNAQVSLSWTAPSDTGGFAITDYLIQYSANAGTSWSTFDDGVNHDTSTTVTGLTNGQEYQFQVFAVTNIGQSTLSATADATPRTIPAAPTNPAANPGNAQVSLSWTAPTNNGGSPITGYTIQHKLSTDPWPGTSVTLGNVTSNTITGLTNGIQYDFRINATNQAGTGVSSGIVQATPRSVPGQPTGLAATPGNSQVSLSWTAPTDTGGSAITDYTIQYSVDAGTNWIAVNDGTNTDTTTTVTGLTNGVTYQFQVFATNTAGTGIASDSVGVTPRTIPAAPTGLIATPGDAQIVLSWTAPNNGGSAITGYVIQHKPSTDAWPGTTVTIGNVTSHTISSLTNGIQYDFRINATNIAGTGLSSGTAQATPVASTVPDTVPPVIATPSNAIIVHQNIAFTVTDALVGVTCTDTEDSSPILTADITNVNTAIVGSYTVTYSCTDDANNSAISQTRNVTVIGIPAAPTGLIATPGNAQVELSWTAPSNNGGSAITDYTIQYSANAGTSWSTFTDGIGTGTTATVTGLTNGQTYQFRVSATNTVGTGSTSVTASATPVAPVTDTTAPVITINGANSITITLGTTYTDAGATCTDNLDPNPSLTQTGTVDTSTVGQYTVTYICTDAANNSAIQHVRTVNVIGIPAAPTGLIATPGNAQVELSWTAPSNNGGSAITDYTIQYSANAGTSWSTFTDAVSVITSTTVTGLTNDTPYQFRVNATNIAGTGPASSTAQATPVAPDNIAPTIVINGDNHVTISVGTTYVDAGATCTDNVDTTPTLTDTSTVDDSAAGSYTVTYTCTDDSNNSVDAVRTVNVITVPSAPSSPVANSGNAQASLSWTAPTNNGGSAITGYVIQHKASSDPWPGTSTTVNNVTTGIITSLTNGIQYDFRINATNIAGTGISSGTAQATPAASTVPDTVPPVIATPVDAIIVHQHSAFTATDALVGVTCTDTEDSSPTLTADITNVNTAIVGSYTVTYICTDDANNSAIQQTRNVTVIGTPAAPTGLTAISDLFATSGDIQIVLSWTAPTDNGGSTITGYVIQYKASSDPWPSHAYVIGNVTSYTVSNLTNGVPYDFRVNTTNAVGIGPAFVIVSATPTFTVDSDIIPPVIKIIGSDTITINKNSVFSNVDALKDVTCIDDMDPNPTLTADTSSVTTDTLGDYTIAYRCVDSTSNHAEPQTRTVRIVDTVENKDTTVSSPSSGKVQSRAGGGGFTLGPVAVTYNQCGIHNNFVLVAATYGDNLAASVSYGETTIIGQNYNIDISKYVSKYTPIKLYMFDFADMSTDVSSFKINVYDKSGKKATLPLSLSGECSSVHRFDIIKGISVSDSLGNLVSDTGDKLSGDMTERADTDDVEPTEPVKPTEPLDPVEPLEPTEPVKPTEPLDPVEPLEPTEPVKPTEPLDPVEPLEPTEPVKPTEPLDPVEPLEPTEPVKPTEPLDPVEPLEPVISVEPTDIQQTNSSPSILSQTSLLIVYSILGVFAVVALVYLLMRRNRSIRT